MNPVRFAIIGIGNMGSAHAVSLRDGKVRDGVLTAVCDTAPGRREWAAKNLPGVKIYLERKGELPKGLVFGLAAIITYYKGGTRADGAPIEPNDAPEIMQLLKDLWATGDTQKVAEGVLAAENIWKENLNETVKGLTALVKTYLDLIQEKGMLEAVKTIL